MNDASDRPTKRVTVIDVALAAGVSPGTVSNAISGKRKVDQATQKRVQEAVAKLGYRPNLAARRMRTGRANTIAIYSSMPVAVAAGVSRLGFLMEIAASAAVAALEANMSLVLVPPIEDPITTLKNISMDGIIVVEPEADDPVIALMQDIGVPTVSVGKPVGSSSVYVDLDYREMSELLFDHLLETGAVNFPLIVGASSRQSNVVFEKVYLERAGQIGMPARVISLPEHDAENSAEDATLALLDKQEYFDAVLVPIDAMATGVMRALKARNVQIPDDVRVATRYNGVRARTEVPAITAIDLKLEDVAQTATEMLINIIDGSTRRSVTAATSLSIVRRPSSVKG
ncbi:MAG: LacI family DNA-binding transcriptional regulator [Rhodobacteraceae bacterium]|nr:LacI family DNA-binding transcriptional regulator [Paracoccaceae bacterium]